METKRDIGCAAARKEAEDRLGPGARVALLMHGNLDDDVGKLGVSMLRYGRADVVAVIDETNEGRRAGEALGGLIPLGERSAVPIVSTVEQAAELGATVLVLAITPHGGKLPEDWRGTLHLALDRGLSIVNPLHIRLSKDPDLSARVKPGRWIWDVRVEPEDAGLASGRCIELGVPRILLVGTDMAVGKMTAGLELARALERSGKKAAFVATGQVGICLTGDGIAIDAVRVDYAAGAVEQAVLRIGRDSDVVIVEGQGALTHPSATANLALLRGTMPTHLLLNHRAGQLHPVNNEWTRIPPRSRLIRLYEDLAACEGAFPRPRTFAVALNTARLDEAAARAAIEAEAAETGLPVTDPVRFGADHLAEALLGDPAFDRPQRAGKG